jgi:basic membrane protein A and related proteins
MLVITKGRYLAGVAAGRMTQSNVAGYVAGFPIPEVLQGLNAFTLGMRSVNPQAQVKVIWLNSWFDPAKERDAAFTLFNQSVDVITFHTASQCGDGSGPRTRQDGHCLSLRHAQSSA